MGDVVAHALLETLLQEETAAAVQQLQEQARSGFSCLKCKGCHVQADAASMAVPEIMALKHHTIRSPIVCSCRRDLIDDSRYDCFGQPRSATGATDTIFCPNCGSKTAAGRFAPHLQRCMGGGRSTLNNRAATRQSRSSTPLQQQQQQGSAGFGGPKSVPSADNAGRTSLERDDAHAFTAGPPPKQTATPPVASSFSAGAAAAKLEKILLERSTSPRLLAAKDRTTIATARHAPYLAIASAAVRGTDPSTTRHS